LSEALALRWQDVDFAEGFLHVRYQLNPQRELVELKRRAVAGT
jgi:integrase